jgi:hypothetical protein
MAGSPLARGKSTVKKFATIKAPTIKVLVLGFALVAMALPWIPIRHATAATRPDAIVSTNPAAYPFETNICVDDASGATCTSQATAIGFPLPTSFTVPTETSPGKVAVGRLVINYVSGICYEAYFGVFLVTPLSENAVNGVTAGHNFFTGALVGSGSTEEFLIQQPTTIYVDPGATVTLHVGQWASSGGVCYLTVNGDLVTG